MKNFNLILINRKMAALAICGFLSMFGMAGPASAECVTGANDPSSYTLLIDASSSCDNLSANMFGCEVGNSGSCTINGPNGRTITVNLDSGSVGGTTPLDWSISSSSHGDLVDLGIVVGANNGGSCGTTYTPGSASGEGLIFKKANGSNQKVNAMFFCSDFSQPLPDEPRLLVSKTVTTADDDTCSSGVELLDVAVGDMVRYCYTVENVGAGDADSVTLEDDNGTLGDSSDDFPVTLVGLNAGKLDSGAPPATGMSDPIPVTQAGTLVNTAFASATGLGGSINVTATDTATVSAEQVEVVAVDCPENFQQAVNQLSLDTGLDYAFLLDPNQAGKRSVCAPNGLDSNGTPDPSVAEAIRVECVDQCTIKAGCEDDPASNPACSPSVCEPSGAWTVNAGSSSCSVVQTPSTDPYCWEVQQDLNQDCELNDWEPQADSVLHIKEGHANPYVYQSCYSSGGRYVCETICFSFSATDAAACPPGSVIY